MSAPSWSLAVSSRRGSVAALLKVEDASRLDTDGPGRSGEAVASLLVLVDAAWREWPPGLHGCPDH